MALDNDQTLDDTDTEFCDLGELPVDGSQLTYRASGAGAPVLLIHGIVGMLEVWAGVQDALATTHRVISYDRRGHGRSPNGTADVGIHATDAATLLEHLAGEPAIVVGWSGGAGIAMEMIRAHSEWVQAAVLIEPPFHLPRLQPLRALRLLVSTKLDYMRGRDRAAAKTMARFAFARASGGNGWEELNDRQREWFIGDAQGLRTEFKALQRSNTSVDHIPTREVASWAVPMIFVLGDDSAPWTHAAHRVITEAAPRIRTIRVPGACHLIPLQQPEAVVEAVRSAVPV